MDGLDKKLKNVKKEWYKNKIIEVLTKTSHPLMFISLASLVLGDNNKTTEMRENRLILINVIRSLELDKKIIDNSLLYNDGRVVTYSLFPRKI